MDLGCKWIYACVVLLSNSADITHPQCVCLFFFLSSFTFSFLGLGSWTGSEFEMRADPAEGMRGLRFQSYYYVRVNLRLYWSLFITMPPFQKSELWWKWHPQLLMIITMKAEMNSFVCGISTSCGNWDFALTKRLLAGGESALPLYCAGNCISTMNFP